MKEINNIKAVIFDLDGTIYNKKWLSLFFTFSFLFNLRNMLALLRVRKLSIGIDCKTKADFNKKIVTELSEKTSLSNDESQIFINRFMKEFVLILKQWYKPNKDIVEAIDFYHNNGLKLVCLSDYSMVEERLLALGIDIEKFSMIKSSEDYGTLKPATSAFLKISESLNIEPSKIVVVGDRDDTDGEGARKSNMKFVKYPEEFTNFNDSFKPEYQPDRVDA